jgi:NTP pyrophosphatase (non-canonical NTP hydrolase)
MELTELSQRALVIKNRYDTINREAGRDTWDASAYMAGFVADVGELSELIMAKRGLRHIDDVDQKLAHELSDCLYSVFVITNQLDIDLETAFMRTMDELDARLADKS